MGLSWMRYEVIVLPLLSSGMVKMTTLPWLLDVNTGTGLAWGLVSRSWRVVVSKKSLFESLVSWLADFDTLMKWCRLGVVPGICLGGGWEGVEIVAGGRGLMFPVGAQSAMCAMWMIARSR